MNWLLPCLRNLKKEDLSSLLIGIYCVNYLNTGAVPQYILSCSSANATPEFEGRGGEDLANEISRFLQRSYSSAHVFDLAELCVLPGQQCWVLYVDILVKFLKIFLRFSISLL